MLYRTVDRFRRFCEGPRRGSAVHRDPPMKATVMGEASLLTIDRIDCVGRPLINLTPKISDCGNDARTLTSIDGDCDGASTSSSSSGGICCAVGEVVSLVRLQLLASRTGLASVPARVANARNDNSRNAEKLEMAMDESAAAWSQLPMYSRPSKSGWCTNALS